MRTEKSVLDIHDVAEIFGCSTEKIKRMARQGDLPAFKFGRTWYMRPDDFERFLSDRVASDGHPRRVQRIHA